MKPLFSLGDTALKGARPRPVLDDALAHSDLPAPGSCGGRPIMKASSLRRTTRDLTSTELPDVSLGDLLWAANGVNREDNDGRTAPSFQRISARYCNVPNAASMLEYKLRLGGPAHWGDIAMLRARRPAFARRCPHARAMGIESLT